MLPIAPTLSNSTIIYIFTFKGSIWATRAATVYNPTGALIHSRARYCGAFLVTMSWLWSSCRAHSKYTVAEAQMLQRQRQLQRHPFRDANLSASHRLQLLQLHHIKKKNRSDITSDPGGHRPQHVQNRISRRQNRRGKIEHSSEAEQPRTD